MVRSGPDMPVFTNLPRPCFCSRTSAVPDDRTIVLDATGMRGIMSHAMLLSCAQPYYKPRCRNVESNCVCMLTQHTHPYPAQSRLAQMELQATPKLALAA